MKILRLRLVAITIMASLCACNAQTSSKVENESTKIETTSSREIKVKDKEFQVFLDRFGSISPPINYKKLPGNLPLMTKEEAIRFLHKTKDDLYYIEQELGEDEMGNEILDETIEENIPGCDFKYQLNDSILILCTRERGKEDVGEPFGKIHIIRVYLNTFSMKGERIDKCIVGERFTYEDDWVSFVLLDKNTIRIYYYNDNDERQDEGSRSTVYYVNYIITNDGRFIEKNKSNIIYLKNYVNKYSTYQPKSDDPMNEYDY
jgi:hypothetical protein